MWGDQLLLRIDWLAGSFPYDLRSAAESVAGRFFGVATLAPPIAFYPEVSDYGPGVKLGFNKQTGEGLFQVKGAGLSRLDLRGVWDLFVDLIRQMGQSCEGNRGFRCTSLHIAMDDLARSPSLDLIRDCVESRRFGAFKVANEVRGSGPGAGRGFYFGRRGKVGSGLSFCIYDKEAESDGEIKGIRYEARFAKMKAECAFQNLAGAEGLSQFQRAMGRMLGGSISFYSGPDCSAVESWWLAFTDVLGTEVVRVEQKKSENLDAMVEHAVRIAAPTFALKYEMLKRESGTDAADAWLMGVLKSGRERFTRRHKLLLGDAVGLGLGGDCRTKYERSRVSL